MLEILKLITDSQRQLTDKQIGEALNAICIVIGILFALIIVLEIIHIYQFWEFEKKIKKLQDFSCKFTDKNVEDHKSKN